MLPYFSVGGRLLVGWNKACLQRKSILATVGTCYQEKNLLGPQATVNNFPARGMNKLSCASVLAPPPYPPRPAAARPWPMRLERAPPGKMSGNRDY